jgi:hypothetical protein
MPGYMRLLLGELKIGSRLLLWFDLLWPMPRLPGEFRLFGNIPEFCYGKGWVVAAAVAVALWYTEQPCLEQMLAYDCRCWVAVSMANNPPADA